MFLPRRNSSRNTSQQFCSSDHADPRDTGNRVRRDDEVDGTARDGTSFASTYAAEFRETQSPLCKVSDRYSWTATRISIFHVRYTETVRF
jgi:hypothetical protein